MDKKSLKDIALTALLLLGVLIFLPVFVVLAIVAIVLIVALLPLILVFSAYHSRKLLTYTGRSLWTRRRTTLLTIGGLALVIFILTTVLMLARGVERTLIDTGVDNNVIILRRSASSELLSQIGREAANIIKTFPEIARGSDGRPMASNEIYVVINLFKKETNDMGNVAVRGIPSDGITLRGQQTKMESGRMFSFGTNEIIIGSSIAKRFKGCDIGQQLKFGDDQWTIVGHFTSDGSGFESEIWGDVDRLMAAFGRPIFSSLTFALANSDSATFRAVRARLQSEPRTNYCELKGEKQYYSEQSKALADFIRIFGLIIALLFSIGAVIGAAITMYASVAHRTAEIGTLRALGFRRTNILAAFLVEAAILSIPAAALGLVVASLMSLIRISTVNFGSFAELAFGFSISAVIVIIAIAFALGLGIIGGLLPALRAARMNIVNALRAS